MSRGETFGTAGIVGLKFKLKIRGEAQELLLMTRSSYSLGVGTITGSFDEDATRNKLDRKAMRAARLSVCRRSEIRLRERQGLLLNAASLILEEQPRRTI